MVSDNLNSLIKFTVWFLVVGLVVSISGVSQAASMRTKGKNWKVGVDANYVYDSNVVAAPRDGSVKPAGLGDEDDSGFEWSGNAQYDLNFTKKFQMNVNYDVNQVIYDDLSDFDVISQMFGAGAIYKINKLVDIELDYKYVYNIVDDDSFSGIHFLNPSFNYFHKKFGFTRLDFIYKGVDNFQNDTRDGDKWSAGITHYFFFSKYTRRLGFGYKYNVDDTDGDAFDRTYHDLTARGLTPLFWGIQMDARAKWSIRNYDDFQIADGSFRDDDQQRYQLTLSKVLVKKFKFLNNITALGSYTHTFNNSNLAVRDYRSNRYSFGVSTTF